MGKIPAKTETQKASTKAEAVVEKKPFPPPKKKINCFVMPDKPEKAGLMAVSTNKIQDGCFVIGWQPQNATWLVSDGAQWYGFAGNILKANLAFTAVFAFCLLVAVIFSRGR